jgi:hypothetical protein
LKYFGFGTSSRSLDNSNEGKRALNNPLMAN